MKSITENEAHHRPLASIDNHGNQVYVHEITSDVGKVTSDRAFSQNGFDKMKSFISHHEHGSSSHQTNMQTPFFHHPSYNHTMNSSYYYETHRDNERNRNFMIALVLISLLTFVIQVYNPFFSNLPNKSVKKYFSGNSTPAGYGYDNLILRLPDVDENWRKPRMATADDETDMQTNELIDENVSAEKYSPVRNMRLYSTQSQKVQSQHKPIEKKTMQLGIEDQNIGLNYYEGLVAHMNPNLNGEITSIPNIFGMGGTFSGNLLKPMQFRRDLSEDLSHLQSILPANTELPGYKMGWDPRVGKQGEPGNGIPGDLAVLWNIPFSGTSVVLDIIRSCHRLVTTMAGDRILGNISPEKIQELKIISPGFHAPTHHSSIKFVNVELSTQSDIARAKDLGFASSALADVAVTPFIYQSDHIFYNTNVRGRLFALFRNPMDIATDQFYYMKYATWETSYNPELMNMSIDQYPKTTMLERNWMTRKLANVPDDQEVTQDHLNFALEIMRTRIVVGLYDSLDESLDRFERYFGWKFHSEQGNQELCRSRFTSRGYANPNPKWKPLEKGTEAYELIFWQNQFDLEIYQYAKSLFVEQAQFVSGTEPNFRLSTANTNL